MNRTAKILLLLVAGASVVAFLYFSFFQKNTFVIEGNSVQNENKAVNNGSSALDNVSSDADNKIVLAAVGDMMLSRVVEQKMIEKGDWKYPFLETKDITSGADLALGNLETTITPGAVIPSGSFTFRTDPKALEGLKFAGFDVLSLANNHMMNFGYNGLKATLQNLDGAGIGHIGAGLNDAQISEPVIKEVKGVKFGFLAYSYAKEQSYYKNGDTYGTAYTDTAKMKTQVAELKKNADVVVVSMHMGEEYKTEPNMAQKNFARAAVDAGADLVVGHHPHVVETFEKYNDGYIIYSLGNFVFDQMWSEETRLGAIAEITFENKKISDIKFVPVKIFDYAQPRLAEEVEKDKILKRLESNE